MAPRQEDKPILVVGAGIAGLITAHTLIRDGFPVRILTRDRKPGGTWMKDRIYPTLYTNNVHGEYRVSPLAMRPPTIADGRLSGADINQYIEEFVARFLQDKIEFGMEVRKIHRKAEGEGWLVETRHIDTGDDESRECARVVICTGGCSVPHFPRHLEPEDARKAGFKGLVVHSAQFGAEMDKILASVPPADVGTELDAPAIIVVGGGKSAQDISAYLANEGRKITVICSDFDAFTAGPKPLPAFVRKSRLLSLFSPHIHLRTYLERSLHTTWLGKLIVDFMWRGITDSSFQATGIPEGSPLRNTVSLFWHIRNNDEGVPRANGFHALAVAGKIDLISPARVVRFGEDGRSLVLDDGRSVCASAVILATGYRSSWPSMFDAETIDELGLNPQPAGPQGDRYHWTYTTLQNPPPLHPEAKLWSSTIYRGIVPAKNIHRRDFAVNGAVLSPNFGYTTEVAAHWISSYFRGDEMRIPATPAEALQETERHAAWLRRRYPQIPTALNNSHTSYFAFWSWPQHVDDLLEDMGLPVMRSGGNALTWPFKVVDLSEIQHLKEERDARRARKTD